MSDDRTAQQIRKGDGFWIGIRSGDHEGFELFVGKQRLHGWCGWPGKNTTWKENAVDAGKRWRCPVLDGYDVLYRPLVPDHALLQEAALRLRGLVLECDLIPSKSTPALKAACALLDRLRDAGVE